MVYELFLDAVKEQMAQLLGEEYELVLQKVPKNNGLVLDGLCISKKGSPIAPAIYLNSYHRQYRDGRSLQSIADELLTLYRSTGELPDLDPALLKDFEFLKSRITFRLINQFWNRKLLEDLPHIAWLDLALVFYAALKEEENCLMTFLIRKEHLKLWGVTEEELYRTAMEYTPKNLPPVITSIDRLLQDDSSCEIPLYVLTNTRSTGGASCLLYPDVLKNFADEMAADFLILPSSIHEVLLLPYESRYSVRELSALVSHVNRTEVSETDRLSDQVYLYTRSDGCITLAPQEPEGSPVH